MIIAIEGMDGSGKTYISKIVANKIGYKYLDKPIEKFLNITEYVYESLCQKIYTLDDDLKALFFGFGNLLATKNGQKNIIIDKHILSTYFWNGNDKNKHLFNSFIDFDIIPDLTIILYSSIENRKHHIKIRNIQDKDLNDERKMSFGYDKMIYFAEKYNMPYIFVNGDELSFEEIVNYVIKTIKECENLSKKNIELYCDYEKNKQFNKNEKVRKLCFGGVNNE